MLWNWQRCSRCRLLGGRITDMRADETAPSTTDQYPSSPCHPVKSLPLKSEIQPSAAASGISFFFCSSAWTPTANTLMSERNNGNWYMRLSLDGDWARWDGFEWLNGRAAKFGHEAPISTPGLHGTERVDYPLILNPAIEHRAPEHQSTRGRDKTLRRNSGTLLGDRYKRV